MKKIVLRIEGKDHTFITKTPDSVSVIMAFIKRSLAIDTFLEIPGLSNLIRCSTIDAVTVLE